MASRTFARALELVLRHEGGFADHPRDPGGATNMGITRATLAAWRGRPVSRNEVRRLRGRVAGRIYRARYWDAVRAGALPRGLDYCVFDAAVHSGPARAARWLQQALGVTADGIIGPVTLAAARACGVAAVIARLCAIRLAFLRRLKTWDAFGRGWTARVRQVEAAALRMAREGRPLNQQRRTRMMIWDTISGLLRHALTFLGGFAVAQGWLGEAAMTELVGALMTIVGAAWSIWAKRPA